MARGIGKQIGRRIGENAGTHIAGLLGATGASVAMGERCPASDTSVGCQVMRFGAQVDKILFIMLLLYVLYYVWLTYRAVKSRRK